MDVTDTVAVLIVDDQAPFRSVARTVVGMTAGFAVEGEAGSGEEAIEVAARIRPHLVLMDINMPGIDGIEAARRIVADQPDVVVVLVSTYQREDLPDDALTWGAKAYVHKEDMGPAILREIWDEHRPR